MIKLKHKTLISLGGLVWLTIGIFLLSVGLKLIVTQAVFLETSAPQESSLLSLVAPVSGGFQQAGMLLIALSLFVGYFKSRFILAKTVRRMVARIRKLEEPASLFRIYSPAFYLVIAAMMGLSWLMKSAGLPNDIRGLIDVAVGSALINGALLYFKHAFVLQPS